MSGTQEHFQIAPTIILASGSPRRQEFLHQLGLSFRVVTADIDEMPLPGESPAATAARLAAAKARAVAARWRDESRRGASRSALIVAADTVVAIDEEALGKPVDCDDAVRMLRRLREAPHQVHTAVSVLSTADNLQRTEVNSTQVTMRPYTDAEIAGYVATGDPLDKAGAYAVQHRVFAPVQSLSGCAAAVMGLPLAELWELLREFGVVVRVPLAATCARLSGFPCCQA